MKKIIFLLVSIVCGILGFMPLGPRLEGFAKGLAGVFFILFYVYFLLGKQEPDKTAASHH